MSDDLMVYGGDLYGMQVTNGRPEDWLGDVDSHLAATPERVQHARSFWPERSPAEFTRYGTTDRKVADIATGEVFAVVQQIGIWATTTGIPHGHGPSTVRCNRAACERAEDLAGVVKYKASTESGVHLPRTAKEDDIRKRALWLVTLVLASGALLLPGASSAPTSSAAAGGDRRAM